MHEVLEREIGCDCLTALIAGYQDIIDKRAVAASLNVRTAESGSYSSEFAVANVARIP